MEEGKIAKSKPFFLVGALWEWPSSPDAAWLLLVGSLGKEFLIVQQVLVAAS
jgi:hypothetical protein